MMKLNNLFKLGLAVLLSTLLASCRTAEDSELQELRLQTLEDGSFVIETNWYNFAPTQKKQAIYAALEAAANKIEQMVPNAGIRDVLLQHAGEMDFSEAARLGQAILNADINLPDQLEGMQLRDLAPMGFVVLIGGGPFDHLPVRNHEVSITGMFSFVPRLYYRKVPGEDRVKAFLRCKVGFSALTVKPIGIKEVAQLAQQVLSRSLTPNPDLGKPSRPVKIGIGAIFGDITSPNQLYSTLVGGRVEFQTNRFEGKLAALNGAYRAQILAISENVLSLRPKLLIMSIERQFFSSTPDLASPHLIIGGNVPLDLISEGVTRYVMANLQNDFPEFAKDAQTREFEIELPTSPSTEGSGFENEF